MNEPQLAPTPPEKTSRYWVTLAALVLLTLLLQLGAAAYINATQTAEARTPGRSFLTTLGVGAAMLSLLTIPSAGFGLLAASRLGITSPVFGESSIASRHRLKKLAREVAQAGGLGLLMGFVVLAAFRAAAGSLPPDWPMFGHHGAIPGLLLAAAAAVAEEIWLRLGIMTLAMWAGTKLLRQREVQPLVAWSANLIAALGFGLLHMPTLFQTGFASQATITASLLGNGAVGVLCGWLYWRRSLIAAMTAHFAIDFVLHVVTALA